MPIIINDFEIVVDPPSSGRSAETGEQQTPQAAPPPGPEEIVQVVEVHEGRMRRVRAD